MKVQEALKAAIEAMENEDDLKAIPFGIRCIRAINQCKSALSEIEKCEPVGYGVQLPTGMYGNMYTMKHEAEEDFKNWKHKYPESKVIPLYTSPISKEWVGLSDERLVEITKAWSVDMERTPKKLAIAINDELKYLNAEKG